MDEKLLGQILSLKVELNKRAQDYQQLAEDY